MEQNGGVFKKNADHFLKKPWREELVSPISHCQDLLLVFLKSKERFQKNKPCQDFVFQSNLTYFHKKI